MIVICITTQLCWIAGLIVTYNIATWSIQTELLYANCPNLQVWEVMGVYKTVLLLALTLSAAIAMVLQWCIFWILDNSNFIRDAPQDREGWDTAEKSDEECESTSEDSEDEGTSQASSLSPVGRDPPQREAPPPGITVIFNSEEEVMLIEQLLDDRLSRLQEVSLLENVKRNFNMRDST